MIEFITGIIAGTVSGTGMGGGTILILILSLFYGIDQHTAQATNLIFFVPTSIAAILTIIREKLIDWKIAITVGGFGIIGACIGAKISVNLEVSYLKKYFGVFLLIIAIYEIYLVIREYIIKKKKT